MTSGKSELLNQTSKNHKYIILLFDDETEVDDEEYFQTLPPNTLFVFSQQSGKGNGIRSRYLQHAFTVELATNLQIAQRRPLLCIYVQISGLFTLLV